MHVFGPGLLQLHVSMYETACFTFLSALCVLFVSFNYKYSRIYNLSLCTSAWHLPHFSPCLWMFFQNSDNAIIYENEVSERRVCGPERLRHLCSLLFVKRNRFLGADGRWWLCLLVWVWDGCGDTLKEGFKMFSEDFIQRDIEVEGCYWEKSRNVVRRQDCARRCFFSIFLTAAVFPLWLLVSLDENFLLCLVFSGFAFLKKCSILWNLLLANFLPSQRVSAHSRWQYHSLDYPCHVFGQTRACMEDVNLSVCYAIPRHVTQMYCL